MAYSSTTKNPPGGASPTGSNSNSTSDTGDDRQSGSHKKPNRKQAPLKLAPTDILAARLYYAEQFGWTSFPVPRGSKRSYKSGKRNNGARWGASNDPAV